MTLVISKGITLDNGTRAAAIAGVSPTLDYRFAREKREIETVSLTDKLTYTGGNGTFVGSDGFIQRATTNVPRFDHNPLSRQSLGLLSEVERTNSIRNNTGVGAVVGTPGTLPTNWAGATAGLTRSIVGRGIENGIQYVDIQFVGTPSGAVATVAFELQEQSAIATQGQTWNLSQFVSIASGSINNIQAIRLTSVESNLAGTSNITTAAILEIMGALTSTLQRFNALRDVTSSSTERINNRLSLLLTVGAAIDITIRIGLPQLELGATASTPIPTTSAAVTRTADSAVIDGTGVITGTYTMVEKPAGCAVVSGTNINLQPGFTAERVMVFPAALDAGQITAIRGAM
jgi:hypothetical protein